MNKIKISGYHLEYNHNWLVPNVTMKWEPANRKWSPTIRIDDYCYSTNFYLCIYLMYQFEKHVVAGYMELPPDDGIVSTLASNLLDSIKVSIGIDNIGRTLRVCIHKPEVDID